ncbi:MAG TPA: hypothetical protein VM123_07265 [archaeon]|nr:hypothetical protein [archaeon]
MKALLLAGLCLGLIAFSCSGENGILSAKGQPAVHLTGLGPCEPKTIRSTTRLTDVFSPEYGSLDRLKVVVQEGRLSFIHQGVTLNSCLDSVNLALECEGNLLCVIETERTARECGSLCDYTVYGEIVNLPSDTYTIEIRNTAAPESILCAVRVAVP